MYGLKNYPIRNRNERLDKQSVLHGLFRKLVWRGVYNFDSKRSKQAMKRFNYE